MTMTHKVTITSGAGLGRVETYPCTVVEYIGKEFARVQFQNGNKLRVHISQIKEA